MTTLPTLNIQAKKSCAEKKKKKGEIIYERQKLVWRNNTLVMR
jgi:hypothetical protein